LEHNLALNLPDVFLLYQQRLMASAGAYGVTVAEKSRRTGYSWAMAAVAALTAAAKAVAGGMDVLYMGYEKDMTREFIGYCGDFAKAIEPAAAQFDESFFNDPEQPDKEILCFRIKFATGFEIMALSSAPRSLRGKQGLVIIDEAAFHDDLDAVLKAALAHRMWGGRVIIISTHKGDTNPFNALIQDIHAGKKPYNLLRTTLDDAIADGLVKRIFLKLGKEWSPEAEAEWRAQTVAEYGDDADEELFCIPSAGSGTYLSAAVIEARMQKEPPIPVIRLNKPDDFKMLAEHLRIAEIKDFCEEELKPVLGTLNPKLPHAFGQDFARSRDLSVFWPLSIGRDLILRTPFVLEMRNVPYEAQKQIVIYIIDRLPLFRAGKFDAGGNGGYLAEVTMQRFGERIEAVMLSEPWYRENMPKWKSAFDDGNIVIPQDSEIRDDHRLVKLVRGVGRVPDERTGQKGKKRHGDSAVASALAVAASRAEPELYGYEGAPARAPAHAGGDDFYVTAEAADQAQREDERNDGGFLPNMTRRVYDGL
jgi:phage FluMu gp28-like protein